RPVTGRSSSAPCSGVAGACRCGWAPACSGTASPASSSTCSVVTAPASARSRSRGCHRAEPAVVDASPHRTGGYCRRVPAEELARAGAKQAREWLRTRRRLERMLRRGRLSGPQTLYSHELVIPLNSTYAPWHDDREFREVYDAVEGSTLVDQYKC